MENMQSLDILAAGSEIVTESWLGMGTMVGKRYQLDYKTLCSEQTLVATSQAVSVMAMG